MESFHATTILSVRRFGKVVLGGDGQVTLGNTVVKANARKIRRLGKDANVLAGFAGATADALRALRGLVSADLALARSAFGRALAWTCVAVVFGATGWLLATAAGVALMQQVGLSWLASLVIAALVNLAITGLAAWRTARFFDHMGLHATRRQLSKLGLFDEDEAIDDDPPAAGTAHDPRASDHGGA